MAQGTPLQTNINVNPEDLKDIICDDCGSKFFRQVQAFKRLSALISQQVKNK